ncbi:hypothetical protein DYB37_007335 [Aphanomyces astaci]|uniref:Origin recognition complex subunit 2 n=1 Tax=Aphanomyces astaci TaxID=112090 RepID=A0A3R6Y1X4_APHAT|nr:hypothetical protein DYB35_007206 [Aphanomyces astaci]RHZ08663.1 hypothetical protein DYB37_007335 [Aphanomyces astaci]
MDDSTRRSARQRKQVHHYNARDDTPIPKKVKRPRRPTMAVESTPELVKTKPSARPSGSQRSKIPPSDDESDDEFEDAPASIDVLEQSTSAVASIAPDPTFAMGNRKKSKDDKKAATLAQLDADDIRLALQDWDASCIDTVIPDQLAMYSGHFAQWEHQLIAGFNLLFTGLGSKLQLLQCMECAHLLHTSPPSVSVCLVIHSIDGISLRGAGTQRALSILAACRFIHVVGSIDHLNAASLWEESDTKRFGWLEHIVHMYAPYTSETLVSTTWGSRGKTGAAPTAVSGIKYILESLTPTDLAVLRALGTQQLKDGGGMVEYKPFVDQCRKAMLVSSVQAMRNAIACLTEHGLIVTNKADQMRVPYGDHTIQHTILGLNPPAEDDGEGEEGEKEDGHEGNAIAESVATE